VKIQEPAPGAARRRRATVVRDAGQARGAARLHALM